MNALRKRLAALAHSLGVQKPLHARAVRRMKARHAGQKKAERQAEAAHDAADRLQREGHKAKALRKTKKALALERKARAECDRAIFWRGRARILIKRIDGIQEDSAEIRAEIKTLGPSIDRVKQTCEGGTFEQRWQMSNLEAAQRCTEGKRRNAYSQAGSPDIWHPYGPGPASGRRDDCSSYVTSQARATGADDPNGADFSGEGFTGTLVGASGRWEEVSLQRMIDAGQGYIVYGSGSGHHTEAYCPSKTDDMRTVGHGSAPVDFGTVHLFGSGEVERYYIFAG